MIKFKIKFEDPETKEEKEIVESFSDTNDKFAGFISALEWAEDYAYSISDKGCYTITREK